MALHQNRQPPVNYLKLFWQLLRPRVAIMLSLFFYVGYISSNPTRPIKIKLFIGVFLLACWYVNATSSNDIADEKIDKINLKTAVGRPLVRKTASISDLWKINYICAAAVISLSLFFGLNGLLLCCVCLALNYAYSLPPMQISHKGYIAPLMLPIGYVALPFLLGQFAANNSRPIISPVFVGLYCAFVGRIILKDLRDIKGDKMFGKNTFVVVHGKTATCLMSGFWWLVGDIIVSTFVVNQSRIALIATQILFGLIFYCLFRLSETIAFKDEQALIGIMARIANGLVILIGGFIWMSNNHKTNQQSGMYIIALTGLYAYSTISSLRDIKNIKILYKG